MAKKVTPAQAAPTAAPSKIATAPVAADPAGIKATVSRNSPLPKAGSAKREISHEMIAKRAYEIYVSGKGGSQDENWARAERELRSL
jgi:Protein of unknown function (DUF2934)